MIQVPFNPADLLQVLPWILVVLFAVAVLLIDVFSRSGTDRAYAGWLALSGVGLAFAVTLMQWGQEPASVLFGMLTVDSFGLFFNAVILAATGLVILTGMGYFSAHGLHRGEFYALVLLSVSGMMLMAMAADLLMFFVALELMSIPVYILVGFQRHRGQSVEAALKYFLIGAFATAFVLYGIAFLYGAVGNTTLSNIVAYIDEAGKPDVLFSLGMIFLLIGFGFKVAAVPFHMWTPDAYQGAPTPVTSFMAAAVKAAAFAAFLRIFMTALYPVKIGPDGWYNIIYVLAILTMTLGNLSALVQNNVKRMLAYSSIAHVGYLLVGFITVTQAGQNNGAAAVLFYLAAYAAMNIGAFAVIAALGREDREATDITGAFAGIGLRAPALGAAMTLFMLSLAGIPPTAGFMGKFYVFTSALDQGLLVLALIAILNSLISVWYYLRVVVYMYMVEPPEGEAVTPFKSLPLQLAVILSVAATLILGILPSPWLKAAQQAVASLF